jgi:Mg-chelatase subunit ChlD
MRRAWLLAALAAAALVPARGGAQADAPRLVRCGDTIPAACLSVELALRPEAAHALARSGDPGGSWRVVAGPATARGVRGAVLAESRPPLRLLVLVDVSGSMRGGGLQAARSALRSFLAELPGGSVRAAVVPFSAARVAPRVAAARFVPASQAGAQVEALPAPDGDTGLYSAIELGLARLADERRAAGGTGWDALLVMTDGRNDVPHDARHAGNDPGLLDGDTGRARAMAAIRTSPAYVFTVGLGTQLDSAELRGFSRVRGDAYVVQEDPAALRRALTGVAGWLLTARRLLLPVGGSGEARLARGPLTLEAAPGPGAAALRSPAWTPPLFALPAFQGRPPEGKAVVARPEPWLLRRGAVLAFFASVFLVLWTAVPPLLAAGAPLQAVESTVPAAVPALGEPAGPAPRPKIRLRAPGAAAPVLVGAQPDADGLRRDLREAPPRRPSDVTAAVSRPLARRP